MKRSYMIELMRLCPDCPAGSEEHILSMLEGHGMKPPTLPEDYCQAIMDVYYGGYSFNQWEEEIEKDEKVMEAYNRRLKRSKK